MLKVSNGGPLSFAFQKSIVDVARDQDTYRPNRIVKDKNVKIIIPRERKICTHISTSRLIHTCYIYLDSPNIVQGRLHYGAFTATIVCKVTLSPPKPIQTSSAVPLGVFSSTPSVLASNKLKMKNTTAGLTSICFSNSSTL